MELKQLTKEKKSAMRNLTKEELKEVQGGDSGMSISVKDDGDGKGCITDPFKIIFKRLTN